MAVFFTEVLQRRLNCFLALLRNMLINFFLDSSILENLWLETSLNILEIESNLASRLTFELFIEVFLFCGCFILS